MITSKRNKKTKRHFIPTSDLPCPEDDEIPTGEEYSDLDELQDEERRHEER